jgi:hypothetical protein
LLSIKQIGKTKKEEVQQLSMKTVVQLTLVLLTGIVHQLVLQNLS